LSSYAYIKHTANPKIYVNPAAGQTAPVNQQTYHSSGILEHIKKQKELIDRLIEDNVGLKNELNKILLEYNHFKKEINQIIQKLCDQLHCHETIHAQLSAQLNEQNEIIQGLLNQINSHKTIYAQLSAQLNEQNEINQKLIHQTNSHETIHAQLSAQLNEQNEMIQKLIDQLHSHETIHAQLSAQLNEQNEIIQGLLNQINSYKTIHAQLSVQLNEQSKVNEYLKEQLHQLLNKKGPFVDLLKTLPVNYPVNTIFVNGIPVHVSKFLGINAQDNIVHFSDDKNLKMFDSNKIDGIKW
jgi:chromosome segregation ATPase